MLGFRFALFGVFKNFFKIIANLLYYIISFLHLTPLILLAVFGLLIELSSSAISNNTIFAGIFKLLFALSIVYAVLRTASAIFGIGNQKRHKKSTAEIIKPKKREKKVEEEVELVSSQQTQEVKQQETVKSVYPKYYRAKQNSNYVFTEYEDRYELFKLTDGKYVYVRTDYKK